MPVNFLNPEQIAQYGHYAGEPSPMQLAKHFHLDDGDQAIIAVLRGSHSRLGFAVQLCTVRFLGCFLIDLTETPSGVVAYLAIQLNLNDIGAWRTYTASKTQSRHRQFIRSHYGYEDFHKSQRPFSLMRQLYARAALTQESHLVLFDYATAWLVQHKVLLSGARVLERWVARIVSRAQLRLWQRLVDLVDQTQRDQLQSLLIVEEDERFSRLELLRRPATRASSPTVKHSLRRLADVRTVGVSGIDLTGISAGHINAMARYGLGAWAAALEDLGENHRLAVLLATTHELEAVIQDEVLDLLLLNVAEKFRTAEKTGLKARLNALAQVDAAALQLCAACQFVLDEKLPEKKVRQAIFK